MAIQWLRIACPECTATSLHPSPVRCAAFAVSCSCAPCQASTPAAAEAEAALVAAGQKFLAVVEQNPKDRRALGNWGNALCLRAELAQDPEVSTGRNDEPISIQGLTNRVAVQEEHGGVRHIQVKMRE